MSEHLRSQWRDAASPEEVWVMHAFNRTGPTHLMRTDDERGMPNLAWCGAKSQFRHSVRPGTADEVTCAKCLRQIAKGQPLSWGAR